MLVCILKTNSITHLHDLSLFLPLSLPRDKTLFFWFLTDNFGCLLFGDRISGLILFRILNEFSWAFGFGEVNVDQANVRNYYLVTAFSESIFNSFLFSSITESKPPELKSTWRTMQEQRKNL